MNLPPQRRTDVEILVADELGDRISEATNDVVDKYYKEIAGLRLTPCCWTVKEHIVGLQKILGACLKLMSWYRTGRT